MNEQKKESNTRFGIAWALANGGGYMLIQATVASYIAVFMTDYIGIAAGVASVIMGLASLWDAINDPIMGVIADRTKSRWGRYRPYFLFAPIFFVIVSVLLFLNPKGLSESGKIAWTSIFYVGFGMLNTVCTMPTMAIVPAHVKEFDERNKIFTWGAIATAFSFTIASSYSINISKFFGSWVPMILIYGILMIISYLWLFKVSKERYLIDIDAEKRPISKDIKIIFKHKEIYPVIIIWMLCSLGFGLMFATSVYYVMYYLARPDLISKYMLVLSIGAFISMSVIMPLAIKIFKCGHKALLWSQLLTAICYIILFFFGKNNFTFLCVVSFIATSLSAMENSLINLLLADSIDFIQLKDGVSLNATLSSIKGFAFKCGTTLQSSGILAVLAITGYVAGAIGHQPESAMLGINSLRFLIPAMISLIVVILCIFYPLQKHYAEFEKMKEKMVAM
ncbi:MFS transporter [Caloramator sp. E03]|uniref:MFS transporter n=1 Tax=Caloramator sp. E03 TaxID=2576307 RepID=UPI00111022FB|nr:MFS transporter [Caloramator sp. E03]QCX34295.1 MFS transporter [Caloramator sp. E03]